MPRHLPVIFLALAGISLQAAPVEPPPLGTVDLKIWSAYLDRPPEWKDEVDLRPEFNRLGLYTEVQGARPSCAVFAVSGALEFQIARLPGNTGSKARRLSEDYLLWGTLRESRAARSELPSLESVSGFSYEEVCQSIRLHGLAWQDEMPNTFVPGLQALAEPNPELESLARRRWKVTACPLDSANPERLLDQAASLLNAGVPVAIGLAWPDEASLRHAPVLHAQPPSLAHHAVLLVGYWKENGVRERRLIFRNSYGPRWGRAGHGFISPLYFTKNVSTALFFTVEPGGPSKER